MSSPAEPLKPLTTRQGTSLHHRFIDAPEQNWQRAWNWLSEQANPIVVKEARQALVSREFIVSFGLSLTAIVLWTFYSLLSQLPEIYYLPGGVRMLSGYLVILSLPLLLVIPFGAYRSMVIEAEERTFELVSISALTALKIVQGKMLSACLQITIYLSVFIPCIIVTYLLRGVSLATLLNYPLWTVMISITLTALSILAATISRARILQVFASICVLALLLIAVLVWSFVMRSSLLEAAFEMRAIDSTILLIALGSIVAAITPVSLRCAAAAIDFPGENHAFPIRRGLLTASAIILFWALWLTVSSRETFIGIGFLSSSLFVMLIIGSLIASERGILSPRVQRTLPSTWLGRIFLTWFYPGSGLGYVFFSCLVTSLFLPFVLIGIFGINFEGTSPNINLAAVGLAVWSYCIFFTGLTRLILLTISTRIPSRALLGFLIQFLLVACLIALPFLGMLIANRFQTFNYTWHQGLNVFWTLIELASKQLGGDNGVVLTGLPLLALLVFALNLLLCGRDVMMVRVELPARIRRETEESKRPTASPVDPFA